MAEIKIKTENKSEPNEKTATEIKFLEGLEVKNRRELKNKVGQFIVEKTLEAVGSSRSPVSGESWKKSLTKNYKNRKKGQGSLKANMELTGAMLDSLSFRQTSEGVEVGVYGGKQAEKADGHNKLTGRENATLREKRRFIPDSGQSYKFESEIRDIIADHVVETTKISKSTLSKISTQLEFNEIVKEKFPGFTLAAAKESIKRTPSLIELLEQYGLLRFL